MKLLQTFAGLVAAVLLVGLLGGGLVTLGQEAKKNPTECQPVSLEKARATTPSVVGEKNISCNVSPDKLSQTVLFDSLRVEATKAASTSVKAAFLDIPVAGKESQDCQLLGYTIDLRGHADVPATASGSVTIIAAGRAEVIEFPFDDATNDDFSKRLFFLPHSGGNRGKSAINSPLRVQIVLNVENASGPGASITVDSFDIEARTAR